MEILVNQPKSRSYEQYTVPKVSIDGKSHTEILLVAIASGTLVAIIILIILTSLISHKTRKSQQPHDPIDDITPVEIKMFSSNSKVSIPSSSTSNLFRYFGQNRSFDLPQKQPISTSFNNFAVAIDLSDLDMDNQRQYQQNILTPGMLDTLSRIKTVSC